MFQQNLACRKIRSLLLLRVLQTLQRVNILPFRPLHAEAVGVAVVLPAHLPAQGVSAVSCAGLCV